MLTRLSLSVIIHGVLPFSLIYTHGHSQALWKEMRNGNYATTYGEWWSTAAVRVASSNACARPCPHLNVIF